MLSICPHDIDRVFVYRSDRTPGLRVLSLFLWRTVTLIARSAKFYDLTISAYTRHCMKYYEYEILNNLIVRNLN